MNNHFIKIGLFFIGLFFFAACQPNKDKVQNTNTTEAIDSTYKEIAYVPLVDNYEEFLSELDTTQMKSSLAAAKKYETMFEGQTEEVADSAYVLFEDFYRRLLFSLNDKYYEDTTDFYPIVGIYRGQESQNPSEELKNFQTELEENGFGIDQEESFYYIAQDRRFIEEHFYSYVSSPMKDYLKQIDTENREGFASDGGLIITPIKLAERVVWAEDFLDKNPDFLMKQRLEESKMSYLTYLMTGMDNTPVLDYQTKKLTKSYQTAYEFITNEHPDIKAAQIITPYYEAIKNENTEEAQKIIKKGREDGVLLPEYPY